MSSEKEETSQPTIDDHNEGEALIAKIEEYIPVSAEVERKQAAYFQLQGIPLPLHRQIKIYSVLNIGDEGGILCAISPPNSKKPVLVSLTHLKINNRHPLFKEIYAYQKKRKAELKKRDS